MDKEDRRTTKEELKSIGDALRKCQWTRDDDGAYWGEADGWRVVLGSDGGEVCGFALNMESKVQVEIPPRIIQNVMKRLASIN